MTVSLPQITQLLKEFRKNNGGGSISDLVQTTCRKHNANMDRMYPLLQSYAPEILHVNFDGSLIVTSSIFNLKSGIFRFSDQVSIDSIAHADPIFRNSPNLLWAFLQVLPINNFSLAPRQTWNEIRLIHEYTNAQRLIYNDYSFYPGSPQILFNTSVDHFEFYTEILHWVPKTYWFESTIRTSKPASADPWVYLGYNHYSRCVFQYYFNSDMLQVTSFSTQGYPIPHLPPSIVPHQLQAGSNNSIVVILGYIKELLEILEKIVFLSDDLDLLELNV